ncbi:DNA-processing protein DprA [Natronoglycomyces albus]|uniref:DNA-processing protein DprA n=1 Tax=Natronoglycomyces albus TaxID=2811108 RepID=A0A895XLJ9_9ACTN|nr:DNA-processing protein DprA [Natronoglycomyces albus]QSB06214.1 DNA-processing protein DprA [Natronoglycomyces albus]
MSQLDEPRWALAVLSALIEPGDRDLDDLLGEHGLERTLGLIQEGTVPHRLRQQTSSKLAGTNLARLAAEVCASTKRCGARLAVPSDADWPQRLRDLLILSDESEMYTRPPRCLWVRGEGRLAEVADRSVAIVGSRNSTPYGDHVAAELAYDLAKRGWPIVSGGAIGIDQAAHDGTLAAGGPTVAVFANGLDQTYPKRGAGLFDRIRRQGLLLSEWPPGTRPHRHRFLIRNRVIAALSAGTVVVEAELRSGARHTARLAAELDRPLMFTPGPVTSARSAGVHQLARDPWGARLVTRAEDVIEDISGEVSVPMRTSTRPRDSLDEASHRVLDCFQAGFVVSPRDISQQSGIPLAAVNISLRDLQKLGWVEQRDNRWRMVRTVASG